MCSSQIISQTVANINIRDVIATVSVMNLYPPNKVLCLKIRNNVPKMWGFDRMKFMVQIFQILNRKKTRLQAVFSSHVQIRVISLKYFKKAEEDSQHCNSAVPLMMNIYTPFCT